MPVPLVAGGTALTAPPRRIGDRPGTFDAAKLGGELRKSPFPGTVLLRGHGTASAAIFLLIRAQQERAAAPGAGLLGKPFQVQSRRCEGMAALDFGVAFS